MVKRETKDCETCGNPIPAQSFTCRFCDASQSVENFPKTRERANRAFESSKRKK